MQRSPALSTEPSNPTIGGRYGQREHHRESYKSDPKAPHIEGDVRQAIQLERTPCSNVKTAVEKCEETERSPESNQVWQIEESAQWCDSQRED
jgi:hypothetical protein